MKLILKELAKFKEYNLKPEDLQIVDTAEMLTVEELKELKRLVSMTKSVRLLLIFLMALVSIFGADKLISAVGKM